VGQIPDEEVERLKRDVPIEQLVTAHGVKLVRRGVELVGLCPFHGDRSPDLFVSPTKNLFHCAGACPAGGTVIDWVMKAERASFREAVERLRAMRFSPQAKSAARIARSPIEVDAEDERLLGQVADYYHHCLKSTPRALAYLEERGLRGSEMVEHFKLGFADQTLQGKLPGVESKEGNALRRRMKKLGLMLTSGREHFMGSLVIPIFNEDETRVVSMYGRRIGPALSKTTPVHRYLPGPHRGVFNRAAFKASDIIVCEGLIDALTFWCAGFRNVTSSYGESGFTPEILGAMKRHDTKRVLIAYDRDEVGDRAAEALAKKLLAEGIDCFRVEFPKGMDANQYALTLKPAEKSLGLALRKARWMGTSDTPPAHPYEGLQLQLETLPLSATVNALLKLDGVPALESGIEEVAKSIGEGPAFVSEVTAMEATMTASPRIPATRPDPSSRPEPIAAGALALSPASIEPNASAFAVEAGPAKAAAPDVQVERRGEDEVVMCFGERRYRVRGLIKNLSYDVMKVNVLVGHGDHYFVDTLDLYAARHRALFLKQAMLDVGIAEDVLKKDLGQLLMKLEELQELHIQKRLEPAAPVVKLTPAEEEEALSLLKDPKLLDRILGDFEKAGVVGEETNKLMGYLACISRKLDEPLAVIIQSSSAAGKTSLMEALLAFVPKEDRTKYSSMTGQSLFYMGTANLRHKILAIVEEEGAERASYALKLLQSEKELIIASTGKDPVTGRLTTQEYKVEGPVMIVLTTTAAEIDDELLNRCIVLAVDEDRAQTQAIHRLQRARETLPGLLGRQERARILKCHQNAQRLLRPLYVVNPFAEKLTFLDSRTRMRRDHMKYLVLIRSIALLHQHQRRVKSIEHAGETIEYIEVSLEDIALGNRLAHSVLGRSLDELAPQTRLLLQLLDEMVDAISSQGNLARVDVRFTRRQIRESTAWSYDQVRVHLERLVVFEYVLVHGSGRGQKHLYELAYQGEGKCGEPFMMGLIDAQSLETLGSKTAGVGAAEPGCGGSVVGDRAPDGAHLVGAPLPENARPSPQLGTEGGAKSKDAHQANDAQPGAHRVRMRRARRTP
jgi:DNA primase catalytic core